MELWIRSQDKEKLVLAKGFEIQDTNFDGCRIFSVWQNNYEMIGKYAGKKRALEVLNEIQNAILFGGNDLNELKENNISIKSWFGTNLKTGISVYEMPEE